MDEKEHYDFAVIKKDNILIALENDFEIAKDIAINNKCKLYFLGDCQLNGGKELIGTPILNGSCRWVFTLEDLLNNRFDIIKDNQKPYKIGSQV